MSKQKRRTSDSASANSALPPGFSTSHTKAVDPVTASLSAIYGRRAGTDNEQLTTFAPIKRRKWWVVALFASAITIILLSAVAWAGFWWWSGQTSGAGLQVGIEGIPNVSIGQETSFYLHWFNRSREPLAAAKLRVTFPGDFVIRSVEPAPGTDVAGTSSFVLDLGAIPSEGRGTVTVTGTFTGALGAESIIQVIGTDRPAGESVDREVLATYALTYVGSVLEGALEIPPKLLPGDQVTIAYRVTNRGSEPAEGLEARITLPEGFVRATSTGEVVDGRAARFELPRLESGASSTVQLRGTFALGVHGDVAVHAEAGRRSGDTFAAAQKTDGMLSVLAGDLSVKLIVNGTDKDRSVTLGERQRVLLSYENTSGEELRNVVLRFRLGSNDPRAGTPTSSIDLVNWKDLDDSIGGTRSHDVLTFTSKEIGQLERLPKDSSGAIDLSVPLVNALPDGRDVPIFASAEAVIGSVDTVKVNRTVTTKPITLRLQTDANVEAIARYASEEGAPVGSGPLPPVAGSSTTYRIEWKITKNLHALDRITVSASLPSNVSWVEAKEAQIGTVAFNADKRLVTWTAGALAADVNEAVASFEVRLVPSQADIGRFADLLGESRFEFTDAALSEALLRTTSGLDTDLPHDSLAKGKGVVKK